MANLVMVKVSPKYSFPMPYFDMVFKFMIMIDSYFMN